MKSTEVTGLRELDRALGELPEATQKNVLRRVARAALKPFLASVKAKAPVDDPQETPGRPPGTLRDSYVIGSRLTRRQTSEARREGKSSIEMYAGTADRVGVLQEFGTAHHAAQPHGRPAWDATQDQTLAIVKTQLGDEIDKAAKRLAKKRAR